MMPDLTDDVIDEGLRLDKEATEGPWVRLDNDHGGSVVVREHDGIHIADFDADAEHDWFNAELAAHARTHYATALREVRRQRTRADEAEAMCRTAWLFNHGCDPKAIYGDDGEMQCGECRVDFKRTPFDELCKHIDWNRVKKATAKIKRHEELETWCALAAAKDHEQEEGADL